ncbi:hypothetical protein [Streptomyces sp. NPDC056387]|uniref:hypothetical protein n=1 Tax=Streptomyces sp. NPDC056387 TaxID=3345803 RepID=UPI0035D6DE56
MIGNHPLQHRELSATAIGIAGHIQSLPGGAPVGIRALMDRFPEGERRISAALRELERCGYLERRTERLATGRVVTRTYSYNKPRTGPDEPPPPPPPPPPSCSEPAPDPAPAAGWAPDPDAAPAPCPDAAPAPCPDAAPALAPGAGADQGAGADPAPGADPGPCADREPDPTSDQGAGADPAPGADPALTADPTPDPAPCPCSAPDREATPTPDADADPTAAPASCPDPDPAPDREATPTRDADADPCPAPDRESHSGPAPDCGPSWDPAREPAPGADAGGGPGHGPGWGPVSGSWPAPRHLHPGAADLLAGLRRLDPRLLLAARDVERLAPGVSAWLDRGADPEAVGLALTTNLPEPMRSPAAVLAYRLKELLPPHLPQASASKPVRRPDPFQTCDGCERAFRSPYPGRCRDCPPPPAVAA